MINNQSIIKWINRLSNIDGLEIDPDSLIEDMILMTKVYEGSDFELAMINTEKSLLALLEKRVDMSSLQQNYKGWYSYHFQSRRKQGQPADMRIIFQETTNHKIRIRGFGNRHLPHSIYYRLKNRHQ